VAAVCARRVVLAEVARKLGAAEEAAPRWVVAVGWEVAGRRVATGQWVGVLAGRQMVPASVEGADGQVESPSGPWIGAVSRAEGGA